LQDNRIQEIQEKFKETTLKPSDKTLAKPLKIPEK
jgi:hypothetical protein